MASAETLLTAEDFARLPSDDRPRELVRGRVVRMNPPYTFHGYVSSNIAGILREFVRAHRLGRVVGDGGGVITERNPDTVRGPDASYFSFQRLPPDAMPKKGYV